MRSRAPHDPRARSLPPGTPLLAVRGPRRSSEAIGRFVARHLLADLATGASVDRHAADQLVLFAALAEGTTHYVVPQVTEHLTTNLWLAERFGAKVERDGREVRIRGLGR